MGTIVARFFQLLGIIFFILILAGAYLYSADSFGIRAALSETVGGKQVSGSGSSAETRKDAHPYLSDKQESVLRAVGVDPAALPSSLSPEQQVCLMDMFGEARVNEIKAGAMPSVAEIVRARGCL